MHFKTVFSTKVTLSLPLLPCSFLLPLPPSPSPLLPPFPSSSLSPPIHSNGCEVNVTLYQLVYEGKTNNGPAGSLYQVHIIILLHDQTEILAVFKLGVASGRFIKEHGCLLLEVLQQSHEFANLQCASTKLATHRARIEGAWPSRKVRESLANVVSIVVHSLFC